MTTIAAHPVSPEDLMALLDGELSTAEADAVSAHLDQCAECSQLVQQFRATSQSLSSWTVPAAPSTLQDAVNAQAAKAASGRLGRSLRFSLLAWKPWTIGATAVVALLLAIGISNSIYSRRRSLVFLGPVPAETANDALALKSRTVTESIDGQPIADRPPMSMKQKSQSAALDSLVALDTPGVAADSNGLFHGLGDHAANAFADNRVAGGAMPAPSASPAPMIARRVNLSIVVKDFSAARASLDNILARHRGYAADLISLTADNAPRNFQASLRIPAPELDSAVADLKALGRLEDESQSGEEVTRQHADLVERLKTARDTEERFRTILLQRTGKASEILQVEEGIARVRGEIESMEAQQKDLEHRVDFAAVDLHFADEYQARFDSSSASVSNRMRNAFIAGLRNAAATLLGIVLFFEEYGPVLLIWMVILGLPVFFLVRRYRRMRSRV